MTQPGPVRALDAATRRWSLTQPEPIADTATSWVYRTQRAPGESVVLKILKPYGATDELRGAVLMAWYGGEGAARVVDIHDGMILMEWLDQAPLGDLVRRGEDDKATAVLCDVIAALHRARDTSVPDGLVPLGRWFRILLESDGRFWPDTHRPLVGRAVVLARELIDTTTIHLPLHGDLHHDNIVGSQRGWLAIDPKGLVGDPAYEIGNVFRNPIGADALVISPQRIDRLADVFAARLGFDRRRVLSWATAHTAISACWDHAAGNSTAADVDMLPRLMAALDRA